MYISYLQFLRLTDKSASVLNTYERQMLAMINLSKKWKDIRLIWFGNNMPRKSLPGKTHGSLNEDQMVAARSALAGPLTLIQGYDPSLFTMHKFVN